MRVTRLPPALRPSFDMVQLGRGMDLAAPDMQARPGTLRVGYNYEPDLDGGLTRIGGIELFDGREEPNLARYTMLQLDKTVAGVALGNQVAGAASLAVGVIIHIDGNLLALTRVVGSFEEGENLAFGGSVLGKIVDNNPPVTGEQDNAMSRLASAEYRVSIGRVPGAGPVRGVEILGDTVYAWRDTEDGLELGVYRSTASGWQRLALHHELHFGAGSTAYDEGDVVSQGGVTAVVKRVSLESGSWSAGTAAGRLIVTAPAGGNFAPGSIAGGGAATARGAAQQIRLFAASSTTYAVRFSAGASEYSHGEYLQQGGVSAVVKRVILESGSWSGTAAGIIVVESLVGGNFAAGAAIGGGSCTLLGPQEQVELQALGVVRTDVANLTASLRTMAIYGCDGVNAEFELRDNIIVPLATGSGTIRATAVREHKGHIFFGLRGSVMHSSLGTPYQFSGITGAAELGTSDSVTDMVPVGGAETAAALMILCTNSLFVLYGNSAVDWNLVPLSKGTSGAQPGTAQDAGGVIALDRPGVVRYPASQSFGNFAWNVLTRRLNATAAGQRGVASVFIPERSIYRVWLADGTFLSGLVGPQGEGEWSVCNYSRRVTCAASREMGGRTRTFVGDADGWVLETDVGRSFAGRRILCAARLNTLAQGSPYVSKQYLGGEIELNARSACKLVVHAEFVGEDGQSESMEPHEFSQAGAGLLWDLGTWDATYWDVPAIARRVIRVEGEGSGVAVTITSHADDELPHTIRSITLSYTRRRYMRLR